MTMARGVWAQSPSSLPLPPLPPPPATPSYDENQGASPGPPGDHPVPVSRPIAGELPTTAYPPPEERGGLVARLSAGGGVAMHLELGLLDPGNTSVYGGGAAFELFLAGAPAGTFAFGAHLAHYEVGSPVVQVEGRTVATQRDVSVTLLGAMGDAYLASTGGLHVAFSWDLARVVIPDSRAPERPRRWVGVGAGAAVGYDIRVARSFYLGASVHLLGIAAIVPSKVELTTLFALTVDALYF